MDRRPKLSIVIPNYQGQALIGPCLLAAKGAADASACQWQCIVVDDASTDDSVSYIKENFPWVILIARDVNSGFSATMNVGIKAAIGDFVLSLNNDVLLDENYLVHTLSAFENDEKLFAVMGSIFNTEGRLIDAAKYPHLKAGLLAGGLRTTQNVEAQEKTLPTLFASGANALMRRSMLLELGGFDEMYSPYYTEDADLGLRAWRMGWPSLYVPSAHCVHEVSSTIKSFPSQKVRVISKRNRWIFHLRHLPLFSLSVWVGFQLLSSAFGLFTQFSYQRELWQQLFPAVGLALHSRGPYKLSTSQIVKNIRAQLEIENIRFF